MVTVPDHLLQIATTATALNHQKETIPNPKNTKRPPSRPLSTVPTQSSSPLLCAVPLPCRCSPLSSHGSRLDSATGETHLFRGFNSFTSSPLPIILLGPVSVSLTSHLSPHPLRLHPPPIQPHLLSLRVGIYSTSPPLVSSVDSSLPNCVCIPDLATLIFQSEPLVSEPLVQRCDSFRFFSLSVRVLEDRIVLPLFGPQESALHDPSHCTRQFRTLRHVDDRRVSDHGGSTD